MSMYLRVRPAVEVALLASCIWLAGCGSEAAHPDASVQPDGPVGAEPGASVLLGLDLSAYFQRDVPAADVVIAAPHVVRGTMTAVPSTGGPGLAFDWSVTLDDATWSIQSNKVIVLAPGTYQLTLVLDDGSRRYAGQAVATIQDGENRVAMVVRPVLGDLSIVPDLTELPVFRLRYPSEQLAALVNPRLGVIVDGEPEQIVSLNPATGLSDLYVALSAGPHAIRLRLYDGSLQRGRSVAAQESVIIGSGQDVIMDLVPLHGETAFDLSEQGDRLTVRIQVPGEVVDEVGGLGSLEARFSFSCPEPAPVERLLTLVPAAGGVYQAELTVDDVQYGACAYSLTFSDLAVAPPEQVASCSATVDLGQADQTVSCDLLLRRRGLIGGELLAVVGVNVFDAGYAPVAGAAVSDGRRVLGITGGGAFGTPGYLKLLLSPGSHRLTAMDPASARFGQVDLTVGPLQILNVDIVLTEELLVCSPNRQCPTPTSEPISPCAGFADVCDQGGTQQVAITSYTCVGNGCVPVVEEGVAACTRDTSGVMCQDPGFGPWSECDSFADVCDESGTRTRTRTDHACAAGACVATSSPESEACARDTEDVTCGPDIDGPLGPCVFDGPCDDTGEAPRTVTSFLCRDGACTTVTSTETVECAREIIGDVCGPDTVGPWSACEFESGVCDETGARTRTVTSHVCTPGGCVPVTFTETQACTRDTDTASCGAPSVGPWGPCTFESGVCDETGTQSRTVTSFVCAGASCTSVTSTETQACTRDTDST
ncbi:MAG TPA: hypothetical protein VNM90_05445, partial [Haliangium sp.]|nr:hypothetical protein [Haliangium sp.]